VSVKKIGKYEILEELGRGGMGVVYRAYDASLERDVALKVIQQIALDVADTKARFYREARMAARLSHDAIAVIYEIGEEEGVPFIAMEYLPGTDLRTVIEKRENLTLEQKLDYARQICRGLQYAHGKNVIHRDIKPENVKLLDDGRVKIIDFGIAKPYTPTASPEDRSTSAVLTRMGMRIGTPWYMSPEQARGNPVDRRTDIFSFGVVLYELLTYAKPFQGDDTTVLYKILHEEPPPIKLEESGLRDDLQKILSRCLAKDHEERYADCSEILRDLVALTGGPSTDPRVHALLTQGIALDKAEKYDEAASKFNQVLEIDPENPQARSFLKRLAMRDRESFMRRVLAGNVIGTVISHFQILDRIGGGGMGVVYRAEDMSLKRIVALKFLMPDLVRDPTAKKRFLKEAQAASALDHPNICTIHEISETAEGLLFICMAFYGGENLNAKISRGPLSVSEALDIVIRIGRGLAKAHDHGIVHRDIKPANIIITPDGEVKIVDFGLAKLSGGTQITRVGARMGTLPFMSPEQIRGLDLDQRTDIWSLAVLLFQVLTGQLPFQREYEAAVLYAIVTDDPPLLTEAKPGLPADLEKVISKALKKDPNERYSSVQSMVEELERIKSQVVQTKELAVGRTAEGESLLREAGDLVKQGRYREALARAEKFLEFSPADSRGRDLRDECRKKVEQSEQVTVLLREGTALFDRGKFREAREVLQDVLSVQPAQPDATRIIEQANDRLERHEQIDKLIAEGEISLKHDKVDAAATAFRRVLDIAPDNRDAQRGLKKVEKARSGGPATGHITPRPGGGAPGRKKTLWLVAGVVVLACIAGAVILFIPKHQTAPPVAVEEGTATDSSAPAAVAMSDMLKLKDAANNAGAPSSARERFDEAVRLERKGEGEFRARSFLEAKKSFDGSGALFRRSTDEAKSAAASTADLAGLKEIVDSAKEEMALEKAAAQKAGAEKLAPGDFAQARAHEKEGERTRNAGTREGLQASRSAYQQARDEFKKAGDESVVIAGQKKEADDRLAAMMQAKKNVSGSDQDRKGSAKYRSAAEAESGGRIAYNSQDYIAARDGFEKAQGLYTDAVSDIRGAAAGAKSGGQAAEKSPEKRDPAAAAAEKTEAARRDVLRMVDSYKGFIEKGDLQGLSDLLNLTDADRDIWSKFFAFSEQRLLNVVDVEPDMNRDDPLVRFKEKLSFYNTSTRVTVAAPEQKRTWSLQPDHGAWKVISYK
jgi:serine/threonine protein kinase